MPTTSKTGTSTEAVAERSIDRGVERIVRNGEIDLAVYEYGHPEGETIVLIHGWPDTHHLWLNVIPLLAKRFHVVAYDTRGHGRSTRPEHWKSFTLAELAGDFHAVIDAVSPERPVHVLAHDWGSVQAWEVVCEPGAELRVASFTSVSGPNLDHLGAMLRHSLSHPTPKNLAAVGNQLAASSYTFFFQAGVAPRLFFGALATPARWRQFLRLIEGTPASQIHLADTFKQDSISGLRIYRANIRERLRHPRSRHTSVPIQLIVNERDVAVKPGTYADEAKWTDQLWRRDIPSGHWAPFSHPQVLATATVELIDALAGREPARDLRRALVTDEPKRRFEDQLVVITGGGSGIGRETALAFAREGAEIVLCDLDLASAKETSALVAELGDGTASAHAYELNVADEPAMQVFADLVRAKHGVPDILINNAGIGHAGRFLDTPSEEFQRVLDVNLNGVIFGCRAFGQQMVERGVGGHIVNLSSLAAFSPQRSMGPYATSKAGVLMFSDVLRAELAHAGIGVSAICPGIVHTNIVRTTTFSGVSEEEEAAKQAKFDRLYKARRYTPDKVAKQIVKAVVTDRAVMPVTPEAYQGYYLSRFAPSVTRRMAKLDVLS
ncbi:SDR family oxidoreductase [Jatrophihabitans sp.]|uniref:SDR family oxidoreductase n=1 Tax=Jatrophihabitans sp. TaxID=1932789 RepID=UPI0030C73FF3|nr:putative oxidoreductase [Jatrophihabitans sp.]